MDYTGTTKRWMEGVGSPSTVEQIRASFQSELDSQGSSSIEKWLAKTPDELKEVVLVGLLDIEVSHLCEKGVSVGPNEYQDRFPEYASAIELFFSERRSGLDEPSVCATIDSTKDLVAGIAVAGSHDVSSPRSAVAGRYQLEVLLGRGSFGEVWKGWDPDLKRVVAVKLPRKRKQTSIDIVPDFLEEARRAASLVKHEGIVPVFDVGALEGSYFIVSEYIEGPTLAERMKKNDIPIHEAVRIVQKSATALHHAHLSGVIHRDIKPANILLRDGINPVITDFGLAVSEEDQLTLETGIVGTLAYMSPEQARGETRTLDGRTDIYSLGVILFQLLTQRLPFLYRTHSELLEQIKTREVRSLRSFDDAIPTELDRICLKCLSKRVSERYGTGIDLANDLGDWVDAYHGGTKVASGVNVFRRVAVLVAVMFVATILIGIVYPSFFARPKDRNKALAVAVPPKPITRQVGQWIPLLDQSLEKVVWITSDPTDFIRQNVDDQSLRARAENTYFILASNRSGKPQLRLRARIAVENWNGTAGFVWGITPLKQGGENENINAENQNGFACLLERFQENQPLTLNIREVRTTESIPNIRSIGEQLGIDFTNIEFPKSDTVLFEVEIKQSLAIVSIDGKVAWTSDFSNCNQAQRIGLDGRIGLMIRGKSVSISDAAVMFLEPN